MPGFISGEVQGRVRDEDWRVVPAIHGMELARSPYCVQLYLPNLQGEFKDEADAMCWPCTVRRWSG